MRSIHIRSSFVNRGHFDYVVKFDNFSKAQKEKLVV